MWLSSLSYYLTVPVFATTVFPLPESHRMHVANSLLQASGSLTHNITRPFGKEWITCLDKPKFHPLHTSTCSNVFGALVHAPTAEVPKWYNDASKDFGWAPCHVQLKRARGTSLIELRIVDIVNTATAVVEACESHQGAGWAQLFPEGHWYLLVYGDVRSESPLELPKSNDTLAEVSAA